MVASTLTHNAEKHEFTLVINDAVATINYTTHNNIMNLTYAHVPSTLRGKGIGKLLVQETVAYLAAHQLKAIATCPYIRTIVAQNPQWNNSITL